MDNLLAPVFAALPPHCTAQREGQRPDPAHYVSPASLRGSLGMSEAKAFQVCLAKCHLWGNYTSVIDFFVPLEPLIFFLPSTALVNIICCGTYILVYCANLLEKEQRPLCSRETGKRVISGMIYERIGKAFSYIDLSYWTCSLCVLWFNYMSKWGHFRYYVDTTMDTVESCCCGGPCFWLRYELQLLSITLRRL